MAKGLTLSDDRQRDGNEKRFIRRKMTNRFRLGSTGKCIHHVEENEAGKGHCSLVIRKPPIVLITAFRDDKSNLVYLDILGSGPKVSRKVSK